MSRQRPVGPPVCAMNRVENGTSIIHVDGELDPVILDALLTDAIADPVVHRVIFRVHIDGQVVELCFATDAG